MLWRYINDLHRTLEDIEHRKHGFTLIRNKTPDFVFSKRRLNAQLNINGEALNKPSIENLGIIIKEHNAKTDFQKHEIIVVKALYSETYNAYR